MFEQVKGRVKSKLGRIAAASGFLPMWLRAEFVIWGLLAEARTMVSRRGFGFDSFFGILEVDGIDRGGPFKEGDFSAYKVYVEAYFNRMGVDRSKVILIEGFFSDTFSEALVAKYSLRSCSYCRIDCDLYSSTVEVLNFMSSLLAEKSLIYFDDWQDFGSDDSQGEPLAFEELMKQN